jgi:hypothetical protein
MLIVTNNAGFEFVLIEDVIEVYNKKASFPDQPVEALPVTSISNEAALKRFANKYQGI